MKLFLLLFLALMIKLGSSSSSYSSGSSCSEQSDCCNPPRPRPCPRRIGRCQCPVPGQWLMFGVYPRPLCFSIYDQPLITCANYPAFRGVCLSIYDDILVDCTEWPDCATPTLTSLSSGPVLIVDAQDGYWEAIFEDPLQTGRPCARACVEGFYPKCLNATSLFTTVSAKMASPTQYINALHEQGVGI